MSDLIILSATSNNNYQLAKKIQNISLTKKLTSELVNLEHLNLPLYTPAREQKESIPLAARDLAQKLSLAKASIWVAPEYNGLIPPIVNNAIAWISRSQPDWRKSFNNKLAMVASHSGGGGVFCTQALRHQLQYIGAIVLPRSIIVNSTKELNPNSIDEILDQLHRLLC